MKNSIVYLILPLSLVVFVYILLNDSNMANTLFASKAKNSTIVETSSGKGKVHWIAHWKHEDKREMYINEFAREFDFLNQDIKLHTVFPKDLYGAPSKSDQADRIIRMIKSNIFEYDVVWLDDGIYQIVAERLNDFYWGEKHLVNFLGYSEFTPTQKTFLIKDEYYRNITGGIIPGPYIEGYYYALWYNKDLAKRIGIEVKRFGMTFEDLVAYVEKIYTYNQQNPDDKVAPFYESKDWFSMPFLFQNLIKSEIADFQSFDDNLFKEKNLGAMLKTLQAFERLAKYDPLEESHNVNLWYDTRDMPLEDKTVFYINGTWMYSHWRSINKEKIHKMVPAELPVFKEVNFALGGYIPSFGVLKNAPNHENGVRLLMHFCKPKYGKKWIDYTKNPTGIAINNEQKDIETDVYENFVTKMNEKYGGRVRFYNNTAYFLGRQNILLKNLIDENIRLILSNQITAEEAYNNIINNLIL